jgi:alginate O-acetyltransferase complex protein AlgI
MLFNSTVFLYWFLPIALAGYYLLAHGPGATYAKIWLCAASLFFYAWWNPAFLTLLVGSIAFNYGVSFLLSGEEQGARRQNWVLAAGIGANLLLLVYYKYLFPLLGFLHHVGWVEADYGSVILPIGISFFTFTQIGYLVDCRQGLVKERGLLSYVLFVTFFPHLLAGPILHHREMMPQFRENSTYLFRSENFSVGLTVFTLGLFKKVVFADSIAPWAETGFAHAAGTPLIQAWSVMLAYAMQVYFDFSGYSDMAIGLGIMFGVKLPLNFNSPYKSLSIIEFWQRWHMTLTRYLTLLLYNPISLWVARRRQKAGLPAGRQAASTLSGFSSMVIFPTMTTMFLAGIWHGAGMQFIVYGVLFGTFLCINHIWRLVSPPSALARLRGGAVMWAKVWRLALTFLAVLSAWVFFRAESTGDAMALLAGAVGLHGSGLPLTVPLGDLHYLGFLRAPMLEHRVVAIGLRETYNAATRPLLESLAMTAGLLVIVFRAPNVYQILGARSPALNKVTPMTWQRFIWQPTMLWALGIGILLFAASLRFNHTARFLYFQF